MTNGDLMKPKVMFAIAPNCQPRAGRVWDANRDRNMSTLTLLSQSRGKIRAIGVYLEPLESQSAHGASGLRRCFPKTQMVSPRFLPRESLLRTYTTTTISNSIFSAPLSFTTNTPCKSDFQGSSVQSPQNTPNKAPSGEHSTERSFCLSEPAVVAQSEESSIRRDIVSAFPLYALRRCITDPPSHSSPRSQVIRAKQPSGRSRALRTSPRHLDL